MTDLLQTMGLTRRFGGVCAVEDVELHVARGGISALIGPNGAGKSTLFNMIAGSLSPSSGNVLFEDRDVTRVGEHRRVVAGIARTFQDTRLFPRLTALENVLTGCSTMLRADPLSIILGLPRARRGEREAHERSMDLLAFVGIGELADRPARELSYGDQRRVAIARALAADPKLIMLDEPAAGMNEAETHVLKATLERIAERDVTVLVIEHDMSVVMELSSTITVLDRGRVIARGTPSEVRSDAQVLNAYLGGDGARASRRKRRLRQADRA